MALEFFVMNHHYVNHKYFQVDKKLPLPDDWKKKLLRKGLNVRHTDVSEEIMLECIRCFWMVHKKDDEPIEMEEEAELDHAETLLTKYADDGYPVFAFVYDGTILFGDMLCNTCNYNDSVDDITYKMETLVSEMEKVSGREYYYLRPDRDWVRERADQQKEKLKMDATMELLQMMANPSSTTSGKREKKGE